MPKNHSNKIPPSELKISDGIELSESTAASNTEANKLVRQLQSGAVVSDDGKLNKPDLDSISKMPDARPSIDEIFADSSISLSIDDFDRRTGFDM